MSFLNAVAQLVTAWTPIFTNYLVFFFAAVVIMFVPFLVRSLFRR